MASTLDGVLHPQALRLFAGVARSGSLRLAADTVATVPSAISRRMTQIESQLGVVLFHRSSRGMTLTEAGAALLEHVEESERRADALRQRLSDLTELRIGTVRLAVVEGVTSEFLPQVIAKYRRVHPGIEFRTTVCGTSDIPELLLSRRCEIALSFNAPSRDDLILQARLPQPLQLVCATDHPLRGGRPLLMKSLDGTACALPAKNFGIRRLIDKAAAKAGIRLRVMLETDSLQLIKNTVAATDLVSFMPPITFARELTIGSLAAIDIKGAAFERASIEVLTSRGQLLSQAGKSFLGHLVEAARKGPPGSRPPSRR